MDDTATDIRTVQVCADQSYKYGVISSKFAKVKKFLCIDYYWSGSLWRQIIEAMVQAEMPENSISFYKGAQIEQATKTVKLRGNIPHGIVATRHFMFWQKFFGLSNDVAPKFEYAGKIVKLPTIAGDNDSLNFYVDGLSIKEIMFKDDEPAKMLFSQ